MWPQAGRANTPAVGRARGQVSIPVRSVFENVAWLKDATGVNHVRFPLESRCRPVLNDCPGSKSGRHGPASEMLPHSPMVGVNGKPLLQFAVFEICQPPIRRFAARLTSPINFLPFPMGSSYTVFTTKT